jgi:hypothetical protein
MALRQMVLQKMAPPVIRAPTPKQTIALRRYKNRKIYHSGLKGYVSYPQIAVAIQRGAYVQIVDAENGTDVTCDTLLSVLQKVYQDNPNIETGYLHHIVRQIPKVDAEERIPILSQALPKQIKRTPRTKRQPSIADEDQEPSDTQHAGGIAETMAFAMSNSPGFLGG